MMRKRGGEPQVQQAAQQGVSGPVYLPPGAAAAADNTSVVNGIADLFQQNITALQDSQNALAQSLTDQQAASNAALIAAITAKQVTPDAGRSPVTPGNWNSPTPRNDTDVARDTPAPQPVSTPQVTSPVPAPVVQPVAQPAPVSAGIQPWETKGVNDLKAASFITRNGSVAQSILDWLQGSKAKIYAQYNGSDWVSFGRAEAGWTDENIGLVLPVAYNGTHDAGVGDYTNESFYARYARKTIGILLANPNLTQKEAGLMALSNIKRDTAATGRNAYDTGFDLGSVPDNYGYGQTWR